jgi:hypothetical protein
MRIRAYSNNKLVFVMLSAAKHLNRPKTQDSSLYSE